MAVDPAAASGRQLVLHRIATAFTDGIPVVNAVRVRDLSVPPAGLVPIDEAPALPPSASARQARRARRRFERRAERASRRAAKAQQDPDARVDFTAWVAIPWQHRPAEARLADVAHAVARQIISGPAWRHTLLDVQRLRLDPLAEAADIAYAAYRLYEMRIALGPRPTGPDGPVLAQAQDLFEAHFAGLSQAWFSLVDRTSMLDSYRANLDELAPILAAQQAVDHLSDARLDQVMTSAYTDAARNELVTADTQDLASTVEGMGGALTAVLGRIGDDVRELAARH